ncbi:MAG: tetratricopeptide repeat protein [Planctomycetes bacterium]|nr:tetratricopeptide repeat protein [Planctomycetota bacterium]
MGFQRLFVSTAAILSFLAPADAQTASEFLRKAEKAAQAGKTEEALAFAGQAVAEDPKNTKCLAFRANLFSRLDRNKEALADFSKLIELDPKDAQNYHFRGAAQFKLANFAESIKDFDKFIAMKPEAKASHWQRGISFYYAGRYDDGREQFEGYQTFDQNDVENAVWRFMCMAKSDGIAKALQDMLKISDDKRVPMRQVYDLFAGKLKQDDVLATAKANAPPPEMLKEQLFYAHLYVGIYYELEGDRKKALEHLNKATEDHRIGHYMWDVARVHRDLLKKEAKEK